MSEETTPPTVAESVEEMAELQFSEQETAVILGLTLAEMKKEELAAAYARGRLKSQALVRAVLLKMARDGSPQSAKQFLALAKNVPGLEPGCKACLEFLADKVSIACKNHRVAANAVEKVSRIILDGPGLLLEIQAEK